MYQRSNKKKSQENSKKKTEKISLYFFYMIINGFASCCSVWQSSPDGNYIENTFTIFYVTFLMIFLAPPSYTTYSIFLFYRCQDFSSFFSTSFFSPFFFSFNFTTECHFKDNEMMPHKIIHERVRYFNRSISLKNHGKKWEVEKFPLLVCFKQFFCLMSEWLSV